MNLLERLRQWLHGPDTSWQPSDVKVTFGEPYEQAKMLAGKRRSEERARLRRRLEARRGEVVEFKRRQG